MRRRVLLATITTLAAAATAATAGSLVNGSWSPSGCGLKAVAPALDPSNVDAFNRSVKLVNDWQQKAQQYNDCLIKEANADNAIIANTANQEQAQFRAAVEKINLDAPRFKKKLDGE